jgi:hypothetical protein
MGLIILTLRVYAMDTAMSDGGKGSKQLKKNKVDQALASLDVEGLKVSDYCKSQLNEYINGRMTTKMMLRMLDEWYIEEVLKNDLMVKQSK